MAEPKTTVRPRHRDPAVSLITAATERLQSTAQLKRKPLVCDIHDGHLRVRGRVRTWYQKQIAQTVLAEMPGVLRVINDLEVHDGSTGRSGS